MMRVIRYFLCVFVFCVQGYCDDEEPAAASSVVARQWADLPAELKFKILSDDLAACRSFQEFLRRSRDLRLVSRNMRDLSYDRTLKPIPYVNDDSLLSWVEENPGFRVLGHFIQISPHLSPGLFKTMLRVMPIARNIQMDWRQVTPYVLDMVASRSRISSVTLTGNEKFSSDEKRVLFWWSKAHHIPIYVLNHQGRGRYLARGLDSFLEPEEQLYESFQKRRLLRLHHGAMLSTRPSDVLVAQALDAEDDELSFLITAVNGSLPLPEEALPQQWERLVRLLRCLKVNANTPLDLWWREWTSDQMRPDMAVLCRDDIFPLFSELASQVTLLDWPEVIIDDEDNGPQFVDGCSLLSMGRRVSSMVEPESRKELVDGLRQMYVRINRLPQEKAQVVKEWAGIKLGQGDVSVDEVSVCLDFVIPIIARLSPQNGMHLLNVLRPALWTDPSIRLFLHLIHSSNLNEGDVNFA